MDVIHLRVDRVRRCSTDRGSCGWQFLVQSHNRPRRRFRMADCGSRVEAARLIERRRADQSESST